jgi:GTP-binding protein HflX
MENLFDRPKSGERALLVHVDFPEQDNQEDPSELVLLADSAGACRCGLIRAVRQAPDKRTFIGSGKLDELKQAVEQESADLVIFNHALSPSQERNLEKVLQCRVLDRTGLILDIFAQRARTHEGKLQVELAQLEHMATRLVRGWTHLERQKGGIGLRGPGETQLESDRRMLRNRIRQIHLRLEKVRRQRDQGRRARRRAELPTISLVGYTNAGKSTLFNQLTTAHVYAADQLFATLDPTLRRIKLDANTPVILADTVGFIRHLPHKLVQAFSATLEESREADMLLHVVDASGQERDDNIAQVNLVLSEIEADQVPILMIYNKIDLIPGCEPRIDVDDEGVPIAVWLSAQTGAGLDLLFDALQRRLSRQVLQLSVRLPLSMGLLRSLFFGLGAVIEERALDDGSVELMLRITRKDYGQSLKKAVVTAAEIEIVPDDPASGVGVSAKNG